MPLPLHGCWFGVAVYFVSSTTLILFNKALWSSFRFPLLSTMIQQAVMYVGVHLAQPLMSQPLRKLDTPTWRSFLVPVALLACADLAFSNMSFLFLTVSLYQIVKSSSPGFSLGFGIALGYEDFSWTLVLSIVLIVGGLAFAVADSLQFHAVGFILVTIAAVATGLRSVMTQRLMQRLPERLDALSTVAMTTPVTGVALILPVLVLEAPHLTLATVIPRVPALLFSSFLALGVLSSQFIIVGHASGLTMSVVGSAKEVLAIGLSVLIFGDQLTLQNAFGYAICLVGIIVFHSRHGKMAEQQQVPMTLLQDHRAAAGGGDGGDGDGDCDDDTEAGRHSSDLVMTLRGSRAWRERTSFDKEDSALGSSGTNGDDDDDDDSSVDAEVEVLPLLDTHTIVSHPTRGTTGHVVWSLQR